MTPNWPDEVVELENFASRVGLTCRRSADEAHFGNGMSCCSGLQIAVRAVSDRGQWFVEIADIAHRPDDWYDAAILRDLLIGNGEDVLQLKRQVELVQAMWPAILHSFGSPQVENIHRQLATLKRQRAQRRLPDLFV